LAPLFNRIKIEGSGRMTRYLAGCLLLAAPALAQQPQFQHTPPSNLEKTGPAGRAASTSRQEFAFELRDNLVTMAATIDGKPQTAVLDSGSGALVVDRQAADRSVLTPAGAEGEVAGAGAEAQQLQPLNVPGLAIGSLRLGNLSGYVVDLTNLSASAGFPVDVLLGSPVFKGRSVTVDYVRKRVIFAPSGVAAACGSPIPITLIHDVPVAQVELRATPDARPILLNLVVDLGTRHHAVLLGGAFVRTEEGKALISSGKSQKVGHGTGGAVQGIVANAAELRIGDRRIAHPEVALSSEVGAFDRGGFDGSLGVPFWQAGSITFDYDAKLLCLTLARS
jgi:hypothetical protein